MLRDIPLSVAGRQRGQPGNYSREWTWLATTGVSGEWKQCFNSEIQNKFELYLGDLTRNLVIETLAMR